MAMAVQDVKEKGNLEEMQRLREEYLGQAEIDQTIKVFLEEIDESFMIQFLRGRKGNPQRAFETLIRYAEVKLVKYPDMFPRVLPPEIASLKDCPVVTVLKARDRLGRRIIVFDSTRWDIQRHSLLELSMYIMEKLVRDEDCIKNGMIVIQDCSQIGLKHCSQYSIKIIKKLLAIFWHAYPLRYKGVYFVNTPNMLWCALSIAKICFPKKLAERLTIWSGESGYDALHEIFPKEGLPKFLKGDLNYEDAIDPEMAITLP